MTFDLNGVKIPKQRKQAATDATMAPLAVCPFTVIVDSREQLPYSFDGMRVVVPTVVEGLPSGDYSIQNMEELVAVERKSLDDLFGSTTWGRKRFKAEIGRLDDMPGFAAVVIEADWREIADPATHRPGWINQTNPDSVAGTIAAWSTRYPRVHWWACGDRRGAELRTFGILQAFWNEQQKK